jgi:hypothetical protein
LVHKPVVVPSLPLFPIISGVSTPGQVISRKHSLLDFQNVVSSMRSIPSKSPLQSAVATPVGPPAFPTGISEVGMSTTAVHRH